MLLCFGKKFQQNLIIYFAARPGLGHLTAGIFRRVHSGREPAPAAVLRATWSPTQWRGAPDTTRGCAALSGRENQRLRPATNMPRICCGFVRVGGPPSHQPPRAAFRLLAFQMARVLTKLRSPCAP